MSNRGLTINCSMVEKDGGYSVDFNYEDTEGYEFEGSYEGDNLEEMVEDLFDDVINELLVKATEPQEEEKSEEEVEENEYIKQLERIVQDLKNENNSLKTDINILQRRADDAVNSSKKKTLRANYPQYYIIDPYKLMKLWF